MTLPTDGWRTMAEKRDYYEVLDVDRSASEKDLKNAFRKMARKFHPDHSKEKDAETRFKEVQEAYAVLSDSDKRKMYDRYGHNTPGGSPFGPSGFQAADIRWEDLFGGGLEDMLSSVFGFGRRSQSASGSRRGNDLLVRQRVPFAWVVEGGERDFEMDLIEACGVCDGSGAAADSSVLSCETCAGNGRVAQRRSLGGFIQQTVVDCPSCGGKGQIIKSPCSDCSGAGEVQQRRTVRVDVPAGIDSGQRMRLKGRGQPGKDGPSGDLILEFSVESHPWLERDGPDLIFALPLDYTSLVLGTKIEIPFVDGDLLKLDIPKGSRPGETLTVRERGLAQRGGRTMMRGERGDVIVLLKLNVPKRLGREQKRAVQSLRSVFPELEVDDIVKMIREEADDRRRNGSL